MNPDDGLFDFNAPTPAILTASPLGDATKRGTALIMQEGTALSLATAGGKVIGEPTWTATRVHLAQLYVDATFTTRRNFGTNRDHAEDDDFLLLRGSIEQTGINLEPMLVEATGETVTIQDEDFPRLRVRSGVRRYWALIDLQQAQALVRVLPSEMDQREQLLLSLLQNEMREPLPILDRCDVVYALHREYGLKQHIIAQRVGYSQSYVSRLCKAAEQPPRIRTYLSAETLTLDTVAILAERVSDEQQRTLLAQYAVQEALTGAQVKTIAQEVTVPLAAGGPITELIAPERSGGVIIKRNLVGDLMPTPPKPPKVTPYWKRGTPMQASPVRLLNNRHLVIISGTLEQTNVQVDTLLSRTFFKDLEKRHVTTVELESLEEALLSDLDAIREARETLEQDASDAAADDDTPSLRAIQ